MPAPSASASASSASASSASAPPVDDGAQRMRALAIALNGGAPRPKPLDADMPVEESTPAAVVAPLRERIATREGRADLLVFRVGTEMFATELRTVEEAVEGVVVRVIPDAPPAMLGIFAVRDRTLPMYALGRVLALANPGAPDMTLVMRPSAARIALAVDQVDDVFDASLSSVRPSPTPDADGIVLGVVWRGTELVTLLDADVLVAHCLAAVSSDTT